VIRENTTGIQINGEDADGGFVRGNYTSALTRQGSRISETRPVFSISGGADGSPLAAPIQLPVTSCPGTASD
jgi:hypothetical protein